jgi:DDE superfamily endonuclease
MEDVIEVYHQPLDAKRPLVCLDETTKQLVKETREPVPAAPGQPARTDYEYERNGVGTIFMMVAPLLGWRQVEVTERKTRVDYARMLKELSDVHFPQADMIVLVQDNLNTHDPASLYEAYPPAEARRLRERFEFHYTPKHGSWLNMAECELSVLQRQCLERRIPDRASLTQQITAWNTPRNEAAAPYDWRFTTADARIKLKRLYPVF